MSSAPRLLRLAIVALGIQACCFGSATGSPPPPPATAPPPVVPPPPPLTPPEPVPTGVMVPSTDPVPAQPPAVDPAVAALARDQAICGAALHCCEAAMREARTFARMEGIDPYDPRGDPRFDPRRDPHYDPGRDPRRDPRLRTPRRLAAGCRALRSGTDVTADRCTEQIEGMRRAFRQLRVAIPSACHVPEEPGAPTSEAPTAPTP
jgi:hypothetical protein